MSIAFAINVYKNLAQANALQTRLLNLYPDSLVYQVDDEKEHLKTQDKAGQWTERWLKTCQQTSCEVFIKIDPDVTVNHAVTEFPNADVFGAVAIHRDGNKVVYGGCMGITRAAAQKIVDSGFLRDEKYTTKEFTYHKGSCQDLILADVCKRLNLTIADWHDVYAHGRQYPQRPQDWAFINQVEV